MKRENSKPIDLEMIKSFGLPLEDSPEDLPIYDSVDLSREQVERIAFAADTSEDTAKHFQEVLKNADNAQKRFQCDASRFLFSYNPRGNKLILWFD